jgi:acyl carrier protein
MSNDGMAQSHSSLLTQIGSELYDAEDILQEIRAQRQARPELETTFVAPRTPTEKKLTAIWAELLELEQVGIYDDFFDLGGHSLLATQLISRVRDTFQAEMSLAAIFDAKPTVADMAGAIEQYQIEQLGAEAIAEMLQELNELSDDQVRALLAGEEVDDLL